MLKHLKTGILAGLIAFLVVSLDRWLHPPTPVSIPVQPTPSVLNKVIPEFNLNNVPYDQAIDQLAATADVNIIIRWKELELTGLKRDCPIKMHVRSARLGYILKELLRANPAGPGYYPATPFDVGDNTIVITTSDDIPKPNLTTRLYDIEDILRAVSQRKNRIYKPETPTPTNTSDSKFFASESDASTVKERIDELIKVIFENIDPVSWRDNGGQADLREFAGVFIISQTPANHRKIEAFLTTLRQSLK